MALFNFLGRKKTDTDIQTFSADGFNSDISVMYGDPVCERNLYKTLKNTVPVIDAAIYKIIRLIGDFNIKTDSDELDRDIKKFLQNVRVNACETGINSFLSCYLEQMLVYGTAVGEIVLDRKHKHISALYNASLDDVQIVSDGNPLDIKICCLENGLCVTTAGSDVVRFLPPLNISDKEIDEGLRIFKQVLDKFSEI